MAVRPEGLLRELNGAMKPGKRFCYAGVTARPAAREEKVFFILMGFSHFTNLSLESVYVHYVKGRFIPKMHLEVRGWRRL